MSKNDDRTDEQRTTHKYGVVARDNFMSGWGQAEHGYSRCAWACAPDANIDRLYNWVAKRDEMRYVSIVNLNTYRPPRGTVHFHIYVCEADHVSQGLSPLQRAALADLENDELDAIAGGK